MRNRRWGTVGWLAVPVVMLTAAAAGSGTDKAEPCCFVNDQFRGVCRVMPAVDETCGSILSYLNNPNSVGKAYCDNTTIRGGWVRTRCGGQESERAVPAPARPGATR